MIWADPGIRKRDLKVCFRKTFEAAQTIKRLELGIWADSRYFLWVNGSFAGFGPSRGWPEHPCIDNYSIELSERSSSLQLSVLVWHYGTSTSQYIHGPAGLHVEGSLTDDDGTVLPVTADSSWKWRVHGGYMFPVPRINVSQPWIEMYDSRAFPDSWIAADFDDSAWRFSRETCSPRFGERDIPLLGSAPRLPAKIIERRRVKCRGLGLRVDYKAAFYPEDQTTEDLLQFGYICCLLHSPEKQSLQLRPADRLWPETEEYLYLNGRRYELEPGFKRAELQLEKGKNLILFDVSGARQRFTADYHFLAGAEISILPPLPGETALTAALGPFGHVSIGNIVCADGFNLDPGPDFARAGSCRDIASLLSGFSEYARPVENTLIDGVKLRSIGALMTRSGPRHSDMPDELILDATDGGGDEELLLDMGGEVSGFLCFTAAGAAGTEIDFSFAENLSDGIPEIPGDLDTSLRFICSGGENRFRSLVRRGFRYMSIRCRGSEAVRISDLFIDERLYPFERSASFSSDNLLLNDIWRMCRRTVELCSEDALVDCPAFEQAFWTGDAYVMALYQQYVFGSTDLIRHCLLLAARSMEISPLPDCHLPAGVRLLLTAWAQMWILAGRDYWMHTADKAFIRELYPWLILACRRFYEHIGANGLFRLDAWNMLDWAPMDTPYRGWIAHLNARLVACFRALSELSGVLDLPDEEALWKERALCLAENTDSNFWDEAAGSYIDCIHDDGKRSEVRSVQTNLMMMIYSCVPSGRLGRTESFILTPPDSAVRPGSPFMAHFYYDYLFSQGLGERALRGISAQWGPMLEQGTCWETFKGFYQDRLTRSYCHAWSSAPAYLFGARILGVRPLLPGFRKIMIAPVTSGLKQAEGTVPVPGGEIRVKWTLRDRILEYTAVLPEGTGWVFEPPEGDWDISELRVEEV